MVPDGHSFHITVGVASSAEIGGITLEHELELVKAAVLYGDRASLCSPRCTLVLSIAMLGNAAAQATPAEQVRVFRQVYASIIDYDLAKALDTYEALRRKTHRGSRENLEILRLEKLIARSWAEARDRIFEQLEDSGLAELLRAREAGILDLYSADDMRIGAKDEVIDALLQDFMHRINDAVSGTTSYALLDAAAGDLVNAQILERTLSLSETHLSRGRHIALAGSLLARLPNFGVATLDEIIDIRPDLEKPLKRFRSAMIGYAGRIAVSPWEEAFGAESEKVLLQDIEPAVLELEESVRSRPYLQALVSRYFKSKADFLVPAGAQFVTPPVLSLIAADYTLFVQIAAAALSAAHYAALLTDVHNEVRKARPDQHQLFFYYRAGQRLKDHAV